MCANTAMDCERQKPTPRSNKKISQLKQAIKMIPRKVLMAGFEDTPNQVSVHCLPKQRRNRSTFSKVAAAWLQYLVVENSHP